MFNMDIYDGQLLLPKLLEGQSLSSDEVNRDLTYMTTILTEAAGSNSGSNALMRIWKIIIERVKSFLAWLRTRTKALIDFARKKKSNRSEGGSATIDPSSINPRTHIIIPSNLLHPTILPQQLTENLRQVAEANIDIVVYDKHPLYFKAKNGMAKTVPPKADIQKAVLGAVFHTDIDEFDLPKITEHIYGKQASVSLSLLSITDINKQIESHISAIESLEKDLVPFILKNIESEKQDILDMDSRVAEAKLKLNDVKSPPSIGERVIIKQMIAGAQNYQKVSAPYYILALGVVLNTASNVLNLFTETIITLKHAHDAF
jgi:hypothetical protein